MRPTKTRNTGSAFLSWKLTGYAEVIPGDPIRAITCRVEMWRGGLGAAYLLPALSSAGASLASPIHRQVRWNYFARHVPPTSAFPRNGAGRLLHCRFRGLLSIHSRYGLHARQVA